MDPIAPEAPTRLMVTIGCLPRYFCACCARLRPERSESPPAANGTTKVMGLAGYCAKTAPTPSPTVTRAKTKRFSHTFFSFRHPTVSRQGRRRSAIPLPTRRYSDQSACRSRGNLRFLSRYEEDQRVRTDDDAGQEVEAGVEPVCICDHAE